MRSPRAPLMIAGFESDPLDRRQMKRLDIAIGEMSCHCAQPTTRRGRAVLGRPKRLSHQPRRRAPRDCRRSAACAGPHRGRRRRFRGISRPWRRLHLRPHGEAVADLRPPDPFGLVRNPWDKQDGGGLSRIYAAKPQRRKRSSDCGGDCCIVRYAGDGVLQAGGQCAKSRWCIVAAVAANGQCVVTDHACLTAARSSQSPVARCHKSGQISALWDRATDCSVGGDDRSVLEAIYPDRGAGTP